MLFVYPLFVGMWELIIILCVILLIFGGKKIPELMRGIGKGVSSFKQGLNEVDEQLKDAKKDEGKTEE
ncbi:MAG: twin-arginine translocase TatA/TatE family subunit [Bacteroidales bacterium]|nr:twin-arginine translocase TatA/TatE family subunit [Bacteroidales bacterium]